MLQKYGLVSDKAKFIFYKYLSVHSSTPEFLSKTIDSEIDKK